MRACVFVSVLCVVWLPCGEVWRGWVEVFELGELVVGYFAIFANCGVVNHAVAEPDDAVAEGGGVVGVVGFCLFL